MGFSIDLYGKRSLETRFVFYLTALVLIMMIFSASIVTSESYRQFQEEAQSLARHTVEQLVTSGRGGLVLNRRVVSVSVLDRTGRSGAAPVVLSGEDPARYVLPDPVTATTFDAPPRNASDRSCWGFKVVDGGRQHLVLIDATEPARHLRLEMLTFVWLTGLTLLVHYLLARVMARNVLRPIRQFVEALGKVTQGKFGFELPVAEQDELGNLKATFNYMLSQLKDKEFVERQLLYSQHLATVGHLAAGVAHEIRNPLASINSLTQLIGSDAAASPKAREYAEVILREIRRMDASIQQLLNFAKPVPSRFAPGKLSGVVSHVVGLMEHEARSRKVELEGTNLWSKEVPWLMDQSRLEQLLINLV
ncbi:MAG: HAMP domain-containing protein, partial [Candidatus Riflebacteria bacterium]|nr:HAMP domain-containing protein [Candidatus Riflebacteria bacterium]